MRILIVTPAPRGTRLGNRITALRWQRILRGLGHRVTIGAAKRGAQTDLLVALHAEKSAPAIRAFRAQHPDARVVVVLTGTDVYSGRGLSARSRSSLERADRIIVLQDQALRELEGAQRKKARVILQSAARSPRTAARRSPCFTVVSVGHLRPVKDPLLAARAARLLAPSSRVRIDHYGSELDAKLAGAARRESAKNPRWRWRGERTHARILGLLRRARAFVQTSRAEGGSSALSEAIVSGLPVLSTRIPGAIGMLGADHPGLFEPGDARGLAELLRRCECDARFRRELCRASARRAPLFSTERERQAWRALLRELGFA